MTDLATPDRPGVAARAMRHVGKPVANGTLSPHRPVFAAPPVDAILPGPLRRIHGATVRKA
jgi:hypothetical protein